MTPISVGAAAYFLDGAAPGSWRGAGAAALGLHGEVGGADLRRVLAGRHPSGEPLLRPHRHRRAGWDLTFAAPKSVSLLWALSTDGDDRLRDAHRGAVDDTLAWLARHGAAATREGSPEPADGLVAASWEHDRSEGGDPHLHTHVVVANLVHAAGRWSAMASSPWWPTTRAAGPLYRCALRGRVAAAGLDLAWRPLPGGLVELAAVPPGVIAAVSGRAAAVQGRLAARTGGEGADRQARRRVRAASRGAPPPELSWERRAGAAGMDRAAAAHLLAGAPSPPARGRPGVAGAATSSTTRLPDPAGALERLGAASVFSGLDLLAAAAADPRAAATPGDLERWAGALVGEAEPLAPGRRWASPAAADQDRAVLVAACSPGRPVTVPPEVVAEVAGVHRLGPLGTAHLVALLDPARSLAVLPGSPGRSTLLAQATVLSAARACWEAVGWSSAVSCPAAATRRWAALTGLGPAAGPGGGPPDIVVVDRADRLGPREVAALATAARAGGPRAVLVDGGTLPARHHPRAASVAEMRAAAGPPPPGPPEGPTLVVEAGTLAVGVGPGDAVVAAAARWAATAGTRPTLVGLGPAEVEALNAAARRSLAAEGALDGPEVVAAGRGYRAGDVVVALRGATVPSGSLGRVTATDPGRGLIEVAWAAGPVRRLDRHDARHLGHGYARTAASRPAGPVLVLGDPRDVPGRVVAAALVAAGGRWAPPDHLDRLAIPPTASDPAALGRLLRLPLPELDARHRALTSSIAAAPPPAGTARGDPAGRAHLDALARRRLVGRARAIRADALGRVLEAKPAEHRLGPAPADPSHLATWRRQLRDLAASRDTGLDAGHHTGLGTDRHTGLDAGPGASLGTGPGAAGSGRPDLRPDHPLGRDLGLAR